MRSVSKILAILSITFSTWYPVEAFAATISQINKKKSTVIIDEGKGSGFSKKTKVCVMSEKGKPVFCAKPRSVKADSAVLKVPKSKMKKIKIGMEAKLDESALAEGVAKTTSGSAKHHRNIKMQYLVTPLMPATYQKLSYAGNATSSTLWKKAEVSSLSLLGLGGEAEFGITPSISLAAGARMKFYREFTSQSDYGTDQTQFAEINQSGKAMGVWFDAYYYELAFSPSFLMRLGNGLDIDMSSVTLKATQKSDNGGAETSLASATSNLTTISLRTVVGLHMFLDPLGIEAGMNFLLPLSGAAKFSGKVPDANGSRLAKAPEDDLKASLDHKKGSFGLELILAGYFAF